MTETLGRDCSEKNETGSKLSSYNKAQFFCVCVCVCTSVLAILMDRFSNQGYLWTLYDLGIQLPSHQTVIWPFYVVK